MIEKQVEYLKKYNIIPKTVLEIGSRDANDANFFKEQFSLKNENIYVVEPNPSQANIIRNNYPNFNLFEVAIDEHEGIKTFNQVTSGGIDPIGTSSLLDRIDGWYERVETSKIKVNCITGKSLLDKIKKEIDICKIDVEGLTYEVIKSFGKSINKIKTIHIETEHHIFWENQKLHSDVISLMNSLGFTLIYENGNEHQSDTIWINNKILKKNMNKKFEDVEIHMLICKKDLLLAINNFKSLQKFDEFAVMPVYLHDDGSLNDDDVELLNGVVKNINVIRRSDADKEIIQYISEYSNCVNYRLVKNNINLWHKIKLFDYYYFSKTKKILGLDTDLLFMRKPDNMIRYIIEDQAFYFPDIQSAYCFNEPKEEVSVIENVNTGVIYIPDESYYSIGNIENALKNLLKNGINYFPSWIEQSAFAHMFFADGRYKSLDLDKYGIPYFQNIDISKIECLHFVSYPAVRETYQSYIDYLSLNDAKLIYSKSYHVEFKDIKIPLDLKIYSDNGLYNFAYYWGLEKTTQNMLDHIFYIKTNSGDFEFKCQSNTYGFFILNTKSENISIEHTYDWYGDKNLIKLDEIKLA